MKLLLNDMSVRTEVEVWAFVEGGLLVLLRQRVNE